MSFWDEMVAMGIDLIDDPRTIRLVVDVVAQLLDPEEDSAAAAALEFVREHADDVAHVAPRGLVGLTGTFLTHGEIGARESYLRYHATMNELLEAQSAAHKATAEESAHSVWSDDVLPVVVALAPHLPKLLPLLLAAL